MNRYVSRPELGKHDATHRDFFPTEVADLEESLGTRPMTARRISGLVTDARRTLGGAALFTPGSRLMCDCAELEGQAAHACVIVARTVVGQTIDVMIRNTTMSITREDRNDLGSVNEWANAWCAALIARDQPTLDAMRVVPHDLLRLARVEIDEYQYALADSLVAIIGDRNECLAAVARGRELWHQSTVAHKLAVAIDGTMFDLIEALVGGQTAAFNDKLFHSLTAHAKFWSKGDNYLSSYGWVAIPQLGLACVAHDRGIAIVVESDYMPRALIERNLSPEPRLK